MSLVSDLSDSRMQASLRAQHIVTSFSVHERSDQARFLTQLMGHGGLYSLMDPDLMKLRLTPLLTQDDTQTAEGVSQFVNSMQSIVSSFFRHLKSTSFYVIDASLVSHISFPGADNTGTAARGRAYTKDMPLPQPPAFQSTHIPAAFTFIGQFIDHDLTMNAVNLFDPQTGNVENSASPYIDLDSVYGPRVKLDQIPEGSSPYHDDGSFRLNEKHGPNGKYYDMCRDTDPKSKNLNKAFIVDARNDENQMILQVHILVIRLHNRLLHEFFSGSGGAQANFDEARKETIRLWQAMIVDDYLAQILRADVLSALLAELAKPNFGRFVYKPWLNLSTNNYETSLPHEFAIGFRMGHSMLKPAYKLQQNATAAVRLFDNALTPDNQGNFTDLRGSQPLQPEHVVDLAFFAQTEYSNTIDSHVTSVVFDLPESTIPDDIKLVGNLVQRNLVRSSQVGLCCGEDLADLYHDGHYDGSGGAPAVDKLMASDIEGDTAAQLLFVARDANGFIRKKPNGDANFQTPLWYYLLKDAEKNGKADQTLGLLGSYLIGEVILGAIAWKPGTSIFTNGTRDNSWAPRIPLSDAAKKKVTFLDIVKYVNAPNGPSASC